MNERTAEELLQAVKKCVARSGGHFGMRVADRDEVVQEVMLTIIEAQIDDPDEELLQAIVRRRLVSLVRRRSCYERHLEHLRQSRLAARPTDCMVDGVMEQVETDESPLVIDVREAIAALPARDRAISRLLAEGYAVSRIAEMFECSWHSVQSRVESIRAKFQRAGLQDWLDTSAQGASE